ncbi:unnamed protein product [Fusarium graminearum]|nr:unnamed protein product [Fusarium graminearum]VTO83212.1 unnamed protein product [Fusarium graminearum]
MDPERPYPSRYGYYYNNPTQPAPGTGYGSDPRQDNPFLPRSSAGNSAGLGPTQEYGEGEDFPSRPAESYGSNLRPDNPFLPQQSHAGGSAQFNSTQGYGQDSGPSYSPAQDYSQRSENDLMGRLQSCFQHETSGPRPETARVYG